MSVWIDGEKSDMLPADDRGLLYGDGFFTTVRWQEGGLLNWTAHLGRVRRSVAALAFPSDTAERLVGQLRAVLPELPQQPGLVRITVTRGTGERGYRPPDAPSVRCIVHFSPQLPATAAALTVGISPVLWPDQGDLAGIKHLNRLPQVLAAQRQRPEWDEALMHDSRHRFISGISSALVCRLGRTLYSPILDACGVDSTTVTVLRHAAQQLGWQWQTIHLPMGRLIQMEGVALLNAVRGLRPVARLESSVGKAFDVSGWAPLQTALEQMMREDAWRGD